MKEDDKDLFSIEDLANMDFGPSVIDILLDEDNDDNIILYDENDQPNEFEQVALVPLNGKVYAILKPINCMEDVGADEAVVFCIEEFEGEYMLFPEQDDAVGEAVFNEYYSLLEHDE